MIRARLVAALERLFAAWGQAGDVVRVKVYAEALADLDADALDRAIATLVRETEGGFVPTVGQVRATARAQRPAQRQLPPAQGRLEPSLATEYAARKAQQVAARRVPCRQCGREILAQPYAIAWADAVAEISRLRGQADLRDSELVACGPCAGLHRSLWTDDEKGE